MTNPAFVRMPRPGDARMGGGTPPILTEYGWLCLWHGVEPAGWSASIAPIGRARPRRSSIVLRIGHVALLEPDAAADQPDQGLMYLDNVVFTTGIVDAGDHYIVRAARLTWPAAITHIPKTALPDPHNAPRQPRVR